MAQRERYLNRWIFFVIVLASCNNVPKVDVPKVYRNAATTEIETREGVSYADGHPFSGIVYALFDTNDTFFIHPYYEGRLEGEAEEWYANRQVKEVRFYEKGRKTGIHKGWYENGKPKFVYHMLDDHFEGNVKEWFEDGALYRDYNYVNGQEEGMERMYWANGKIRANYQSVNGRKYGLTGVKNCVSVWSGDSVVRR